MKRKIAAILAADIAGYSRLVSEDEEETLRRLTDYQRLFKEQITEAGGRVFKTAGDSVLAEFPSAVDALRCAVNVQESLRIRNQAYPASRQMAYRIGLTIGDVVDQDGDLLGDGVNIAARLETLAQPGGICVSKVMHDAVSSKLSVTFKDLGQQTVKNIPAPIHVFAVLPDSGSKPAAFGGSLSASQRKTWMTRANAIAGLAVAIASAAVVWALQHSGEAPQKPATEVTSVQPAEAPPAAVEPAVEATSPPSVAALETPAVEAPSASPTVSPPEPSASPENRPTESATPPSEDVAAAVRLRRMRWNHCRGEDTPAALQGCSELLSDTAIDAEGRSEAQRRLGLAQRKNGDLDLAIASLGDSIQSHATATAYADRATAYLLKGDFATAIADYDEAIKRDANNGESWNNRAWTHYKMGAHKKALADANQAVKLIGDKAYVWDTRGHINEALGERAAAEADFLKALTIDPGLASSKSGVKRLTGR